LQLWEWFVIVLWQSIYMYSLKEGNWTQTYSFMTHKMIKMSSPLVQQKWLSKNAASVTAWDDNIWAVRFQLTCCKLNHLGSTVSPVIPAHNFLFFTNHTLTSLSQNYKILHTCCWHIIVAEFVLNTV